MSAHHPWGQVSQLVTWCIGFITQKEQEEYVQLNPDISLVYRYVACQLFTN